MSNNISGEGKCQWCQFCLQGPTFQSNITPNNNFLSDFNQCLERFQDFPQDGSRIRKIVTYSQFCEQKSSRIKDEDQKFNPDDQPRYYIKNKKKRLKNKNCYVHLSHVFSKLLQNLGAKLSLYEALKKQTKFHLYEVLKKKQLQQYFAQIFLSKKLIREIQLGEASLKNVIYNIKCIEKLKKRFLQPLQLQCYQI